MMVIEEIEAQCEEEEGEKRRESRAACPHTRRDRCVRVHSLRSPRPFSTDTNARTAAALPHSPLRALPSFPTPPATPPAPLSLGFI